MRAQIDVQIPIGNKDDIQTDYLNGSIRKYFFNDGTWKGEIFKRVDDIRCKRCFCIFLPFLLCFSHVKAGMHSILSTKVYSYLQLAKKIAIIAFVMHSYFSLWQDQ